MMEAAPTPERFLSRLEVAAMFGVSPATVDRLEAEGIITPRRQLGRGRVGWLLSEAVESLRALPAGPLTARTRAARAPEAQARAVTTRRDTLAKRAEAEAEAASA